MKHHIPYCSNTNTKMVQMNPTDTSQYIWRFSILAKPISHKMISMLTFEVGIFRCVRQQVRLTTTGRWKDDQEKVVVVPLHSHWFQWHVLVKVGVLHHAHCSEDEN